MKSLYLPFFYLPMLIIGCHSSVKNDNFNELMHLCEQTTLSYVPKNKIDTETGHSECCAFPKLDNRKIDSFVVDCIKQRNYRPVKFGCVLYLRYYFAMQEKNSRTFYPTFPPSFDGLSNIVDTVVHKSIGGSFDSVPSVCNWCLRSEKDIDDIDFVRKEYQRLKKEYPTVLINFSW
jgi:hypothetical protein